MQNIMVADDIQYDQHMLEHNYVRANEMSLFSITIFLKYFQVSEFSTIKYSSKIFLWQARHVSIIHQSFALKMI